MVINTTSSLRAFVDTNPTAKLLTSGWPVIRLEFRQDLVALYERYRLMSATIIVFCISQCDVLLAC